MQKATTDDIGAIAARLDAQTIVLVELFAELEGADVEKFSKKYSKRYDALTAKFRDGLVSQMPELTKFCAEFLRMQGVVIYPEPRKISGIAKRSNEAPVPKVPLYERE